ncbi:MAG TPA: hypothetical protein VFZ09_36315 [Archangium sp.]|uniref:hypothetical protein n=1 Tax=Archangium sp. TaxID=1872627 RepID=UPI002E351659|nr:hypothetical protein [Archangium sp.]HEX5751741.1 hypothetical protein [Archangium sp.]
MGIGRFVTAVVCSSWVISGTGGCGATEDSWDTEENSLARTEAPLAQEALQPVVSAEYKLPASVDPDILPDRFTELWARVYRPATLKKGKRYPVIVFLHGNHATCGTGANPRVDDNAEYTETGTCPPDYVVVPSHAGYGYIAEPLAARGYIVVSINANRGINAARGIRGDPGLNLARGRLILEHLVQLSRWNRGLEPTPTSLGVSLRGQLDFQQLGLMGHSRGGEGARAAYAQYRDPGSPWKQRIPDSLRFHAIFEIGPVDGQTSRVLDANGTRWNVLLPMCDGDVFNLQGVRPFDRMLFTENEHPERMKSTFTVWGANHNYYNTEWQESDSPGCTGHEPLFSTEPGVSGSAAQRETGRIPMLAFFLANVGQAREQVWDRIFDPQFPVPPSLAAITRVDRGMTPSPDDDITLRLEDFLGPTGMGSSGVPNDASHISIEHGPLPEHDPRLHGARISWTSAGRSTWFQANFAPPGEGLSLEHYATLDFRIDRAPSGLNSFLEPTHFSVQLVDAKGHLSEPLDIADFVDLRGPVGGPFGDFHSMLQTARLPLQAFRTDGLEEIRGVRFTFDQTPSGELFLANLRASTQGATTHYPLAARPAPGGVAALAAPFARRQVPGRIVRFLMRQDGLLELELRGDEPFAVRDELLTLVVGGLTSTSSHYPDPSDLRRVVFTLTPQELARVKTGEPLRVRYGAGPSNPEWTFGPLIQ